MRTSLRAALTALALSLALPVAMHAGANDPCGPNFTYTALPGGGFSCTPNAAAAPEIGVSSSVTGIAVLIGGALMLRGRKRRVVASATPAIA